ncbi:MAG TPA: hypothetical protein VFN10_17505, partial [Thermoanaerobaculia bacterium]|nr:hypothetical protein [Thermoanaerobaculia bacterium]
RAPSPAEGARENPAGEGAREKPAGEGARRSNFFARTNSRAASARGAAAYQEKKYTAAVHDFAEARKLAPNARTAFNLGTAQIAAGDRTNGSATLEEAIKDPALRAKALYNRGNSALAANALDYAIRDYKGSLRLDPRNAAAKRNLEIALEKHQQQQKKSNGGGNQQKPQPQPQKPNAPNQGQKQQQGQQADMEALLRSVQQQEQEELTRMKGGRADKTRVGW